MGHRSRPVQIGLVCSVRCLSCPLEPNRLNPIRSPNLWYSNPVTGFIVCSNVSVKEDRSGSIQAQHRSERTNILVVAREPNVNALRRRKVINWLTFR
jgi:hypothetical protein